GRAGQYDISHAVSVGIDAVRHDVCDQYAGRSRTVALSPPGLSTMTAAQLPPPSKPPASSRTGQPPPRRRMASPAVSVIAQGESMAWLMGGALAICLLMVVGLLALVIYFGS